MQSPGLANVTIRWLCVIATAAALAGCSGSSKKASGKSSGGGADSGGAANEKLPPVDVDTAITVDDGRVAVASPTGWFRSPRSKEFVVRYQPTGKKSFPSIVVMADDAPAAVASVDAGSHAAFVEAIAAGLAEKFTSDGKSTLVRKPAAVKLGDHFGATWSAPLKAKVGGLTEPIDRVSYAVVVAGRMYTVEARAPKGKLDAEAKLLAKAVASTIAPPKPKAAEPEPEPAAEPAAEPADAQEKPAA